jgi:hypothetical protein
MRAAHDQHERIDLIAVDPELFVDSEVFAHRAAERATGTSRLRWFLKALGLVVAIATTAAIWWPRAKNPEWQVFKPAVVPAAGLTEELVFDDPPGLLLAVDLAPPPVDVRPESGYVFAEPGGAMLTRRWASFRTHSTSLPEAPASGDVANVGGVPAEVWRVRVRHVVEWGPLDGRIWTVTTNRFSEAESIEFANHVAVIEGRPALANRYDLGAMRPVGSIAALDCVVTLTSLLAGDRLYGPVMPTMLTWESTAETNGRTVSLASIAAPSDALPLVEFVLGAGQAITVHGRAAVAITSKALGPVVAWLEDGRLVMVVGDLADDDLADDGLADDELTTLAESVRPATAGEWRVVGRTDIRSEAGVSFNLADSVTLFDGVDPATGEELAFTVQVVAAQLLVCVEGTPTHGVVCDTIVGSVELPLLTTLEIDGRRFVLGIADSEAELHVKVADGTLALPLADFGPGVPGLAVATLLPADYGTITLQVADEVLAAI